MLSKMSQFWTSFVPHQNNIDATKDMLKCFKNQDSKTNSQFDGIKKCFFDV